MKLKLKHTPEQVELIEAIGSKDPITSAEASQVFAAFIGPVIQKVIQHAGTAGIFYNDVVYDEDDSPSYPLDLYYNESEGYVNVWSQSMAGGLPTSQVEGVAEMKIATYRIDSAVSFMKRYARKHRLDVIGKALERMAQEVLVKQERNAWAVLLRALAAPANASQLAKGSTHGAFKIDDLSQMMTRIRRLNGSWINDGASTPVRGGGTPVGADSVGLTDLFVSPEVKGDIRAFAYNSMHTAVGTAAGGDAGPVPLPDNVREDIYRSAGAAELYGVRINEMMELGNNGRYNKLFDSFHSGGTLGWGSNGATPGAFNAANDELIIGLDATRDAFIRPIAAQNESGSQFMVLPDDQFVARADKTGYYGWLEEGRVCIDSRVLSGLII
jgi:hypothetical protein